MEPHKLHRLPPPWYAWLQVRLYKEHSKEVTDLCFDGSAEYLASCSADGSAAVSDAAGSAGQAPTSIVLLAPFAMPVVMPE